jgi:hypothetical protein
VSDTTIVAGWYPDPAGVESLRYWDGASWTANVRSEPAPQPAPVIPAPTPAPAPAPAPARAVTDAADRSHYVPMARRSGAFVDQAARSGRRLVFTPAGWWLALSPAWIGVVQGVLGMFVSERSPVALVMLLAMTLLSAALTMRDRGALVASGVNNAASAWWWLLTPFVYLLIRAFRVGGAGWVLPVVYLLSVPVVVVVIIVVFTALYSLPLT